MQGIVSSNDEMAAAPDSSSQPVDPQFDLRGFLRQELNEHKGVFDQMERAIETSFPVVLQAFETTVRQGGKILVFGNGGSAADAQHIAAELVIRYKLNRQPIAAIALTTDTSALTACGNDLGFEEIFARQVEALVHRADAVMGISTSGTSPNVIAGLREAKRRGAYTIGLTGGDAGDLPKVCDAIILAPSRVTARIQEMHILVAHMLCKGLELRLGLV